MTDKQQELRALLEETIDEQVEQKVAKIKMKRFETINPCLNCDTTECGLVDGQESQKCIDYLSLKKEFENIKKEYDFTRKYIHDNGLEWDLLSKWNAREVVKNNAKIH